MKKFLSAVCCVAVVSASAIGFTGCNQSNRSEVLKISLPSAYMDYDILAEFESWYKEQTGETVKVEKQEFLTVEEVGTKIETGKEDLDLICPSDYMVEHLLKAGLLKKVDKSIVKIEDLIKTSYLDTTKVFDPTLEYAVPYMYGTFGLMYDYSKTGKHIDSWEAIFTDKDNDTTHEFYKKCSAKFSMREAYASACIYNNRSALNTLSLDGTVYSPVFNAKLQSIYEDATPETVAAAKQTLNRQKNLIISWDEETAKFDMALGNTDLEVALTWSCDAGYVMNDYEDDNGEEHTGNRNLWYVIPKEGGNVYIDAFVIPAYAKNEKAANYFLAFLCQKDIAIANSEEAGAISPVKSAYDALYEEYNADDFEMFDGESAEWREMYLDMLFPSAQTLLRCGVMKDFGDKEQDINRMFTEVTIG